MTSQRRRADAPFNDRSRMVLGRVLDDLDIEFYEPYTRVLDSLPRHRLAALVRRRRMNIVHNCLDKWTGHADGARAALRWEGEEGTDAR